VGWLEAEEAIEEAAVKKKAKARARAKVRPGVNRRLEGGEGRLEGVLVRGGDKLVRGDRLV
jgi:hypothetical protein